MSEIVGEEEFAAPLTPNILANNILSSNNINVSPEKPAIVVNFDWIPPVLKQMKRWMNWSYIKYDAKKKKWNKNPIKSGWSNNENLLTFDEAKSICEKSNNSIGLGFALKDGPIVVFDLDGLDIQNIKQKGRDIGFIKLLDNLVGSYSEKSVSGGLHIIIFDGKRKFKSRLSSNPIKCNDCDHIEVFTPDDGRFAVVTGDIPTPEMGEIKELSDVEIFNILEWIRECDGEIPKSISYEKNGIKPLKNIKFTQNALPPCVKNIISRLDNHMGVDHDKRVMLSSFLLSIGLNVVEVLEYFKNADDFNEEITSKNILFAEEKMREGKGYNYGCSRISKWVNKDDDTPICDKKCVSFTTPRDVYVLNVTNIERGIEIEHSQPVTEISEDELNNICVSDDTKPFNFGLENNIIRDWMDYHSTQSDAFLDYHHASAITALSILIDRKAVLKLKQLDIFTVVWTFILGKSTISRKSVSLGQLSRFEYMFEQLDSNVPVERRRYKLPNDFTPQSFVEDLSDHPRSFYINDECGNLIQTVNKSNYMNGMRALFCSIYDCVSFTRKLRTKRNRDEKTLFRVEDPYLPSIFATVPSTITKFTSYEDLSSGWMYRFLYYYPKYEREFMPLLQAQEEDYVELNKLTEKLGKINTFFENLKKPIEFYVEPDALQEFTEWNKKIDMESANKSDDDKSSSGRLTTYAYKLAMIYEIADHGFVEKFKSINKLEKLTINENKLVETSGGIVKEFQDSTGNVIQKDDVTANEKFHQKLVYPITLEKIKEACREIDEYFIPMFARVLDLQESGDNKNIQENIIRVLKQNNCKVDKTFLYRKLHIESKKVNEALLDLIESSKEVKMYDVKGKTKSRSIIVYSPVD